MAGLKARRSVPKADPDARRASRDRTRARKSDESGSDRRAAGGRGRSDETQAGASPLLVALHETLPCLAPADVVLRGFFRAHPELGRRDRAEIAETVFDVLRNRRLYAHLAQGGAGPIERRVALLSVAARGLLEAGTPGRTLLPKPEPEEAAWLAHAQAVSRQPMSLAVRASLPDWLAERLQTLLGDEGALSLGVSLLESAPLQLRVNTLKAQPQAVLEALSSEGIAARRVPIAPLALELEGHPALERSETFLSGHCEVQDAGSQLLALLTGARRGQTVIDLCAGAGGKTLALAAAMHSLGQVFACDVSAARLQRMRPRLLRSGATNVQPFAIDSLADRKLQRLAGRADAVLVDAPCTGTGTLRRNPDIKWRSRPEDLDRLVIEQRSILEAAARLVRPGGVLVYGTCSLLAEENESQVAWFEAAHPNFRREDAREVLAATDAQIPPDAVRDGMLRCLPDRHETDGFFGVRWRREDPSSPKGARHAPEG